MTSIKKLFKEIGKSIEKSAPSLSLWVKRGIRVLKELPDSFENNAPIAVPATLLIILFIFLILL